MRSLFFIMVICFIAACGNSSTEEIKAEQLVKMHLDSLNYNTSGYEILGYGNFHSINTKVEDEPNYEKYQHNSFKLDSINHLFSPKIRGWVIDVTYKGKDNYGNFGKHVYQCSIDKNLSKFIVGIETDNISTL